MLSRSLDLVFERVDYIDVDEDTFEKIRHSSNAQNKSENRMNDDDNKLVREVLESRRLINVNPLYQRCYVLNRSPSVDCMFKLRDEHNKYRECITVIVDDTDFNNFQTHLDEQLFEVRCRVYDFDNITQYVLRKK